MKAVAAIALVGAVAAIGPVITKKEDTPTKSHQVATMLTLSAITAMTGVDRFYLGFILLGALKAITFGGAGIWALVDAIFISHCWMTDNWDRVMDGCREDQLLLRFPRDGGKVTVKESAKTAAKETEKAADDASQW